MLSKLTVAFLLLAAASRAALSPFGKTYAAQPTGKDDCALLLEGPGKSSIYDHAQNLFYGGAEVAYQAGTCITYSAVNAALAQALTYLRVDIPEREWMAEQLATVGELFLEVSRILARSYGLSVYDVENKLPLLDTYHTDLLRYCPDYLSPLQCVPGRYRRFDGLCNNLINPTWGARLTTFTRLIPPAYYDGISEPRIGYDGLPLPSARFVTSHVHFEEGYNEHAATTMIVSWGQFMDHDFTLTGTMNDPLNRNEFEECCRPPHGEQPNKYCFNIQVPADDEFFGRFGVRCMDFVRGFPGVRHGCRLGSRNQFNLLTSTIDANTVYGVRESFARSLRSGYGGQMRVNPVLRSYGLKDLLPPKTNIPDEGCTRSNANQLCFDAGEIRVNEQLILASQHTIWVRQHNLIATRLAQINPHWDDEQLFQESRHIVIAMIQHITYNEFLPVVLGKDIIHKFHLLLQKEGYWKGYDASVNPGISAAFAAAAFRFGHTLLPTNVERWSKQHRYITHTPLSDLIRQPFDLYEPGVFDEYILGLTNQPALAFDDFVTAEVTTMLFRKIGERHGVDLTAFNLQRNREFGLPGYTTYRKFCGHSPVETWEDLLGSMSNDTVRRFASVLRSPHDIDLWSGGVAERALPGSLVGPTFACIIATQFSTVRSGDRFWYELGDQPSSFTIYQLEEIRKARLSRVLCDNTDLVETIQLYPMVLPDHEINPRVSCKSSVIPYMDLSKWADAPGTYVSKTPTLVQPLPHSAGSYSDPTDKDGVTLNVQALTALREALSVGHYAGAFVGPHRSPLYPHAGKVKPIPTRRPLVYSQEYIDDVDTKLTHAGLPGLSGLYNILSVDITTTNSIFKRAIDKNQSLDIYDPFAPKTVAEFRSGMEEAADSMAHGPLKLSDRITVRKFKPIHGPYGNFSLQDFVSLAERMLENTDPSPTKAARPASDDALFKGDDHQSATGQVRVPASNQGAAAASRNRQPPPPPAPSRLGTPPIPSPFEGADVNGPARRRQQETLRRPHDRRFKRSSNKSNKGETNREADARLSVEPDPSQLRESTQGPTLNETAEAERGEVNSRPSQDLETAMKAVKALEQSYRSLYEEIDKARQLFADSDPVRKSLDDLLAGAAMPASLPLIPNPSPSTANHNITR